MADFSNINDLLPILTLVGQGVNVYIAARIKAEIAASEKRTLKEVHQEYVPRELCEERMRAFAMPQHAARAAADPAEPQRG